MGDDFDVSGITCVNNNISRIESCDVDGGEYNVDGCDPWTCPHYILSRTTQAATSSGWNANKNCCTSYCNLYFERLDELVYQIV